MKSLKLGQSVAKNKLLSTLTPEGVYNASIKMIDYKGESQYSNDRFLLAFELESGKLEWRTYELNVKPEFMDSQYVQRTNEELRRLMNILNITELEDLNQFATGENIVVKIVHYTRDDGSKGLGFNILGAGVASDYDVNLNKDNRIIVGAE